MEKQRMSTMDTHRPSGKKKVDLYKWGVKDSPGVLRMIDKHEIAVEHLYQRDAKHRRALEIAGSWSWVACGALVVAQRDGRYWVIDGQHRLLAAMQRTDISLLPCVVFATHDLQPEAAGFVSANTMRGPVRMMEHFRASILAQDPHCLALLALCKQYGAKIPTTANGVGNSEPGEISCMGLLSRIFADNPDVAERSFALCVDLAMRESLPVSFILLAGIRDLDRLIPGCLSDGRFCERIYRAGATALIAAAKKYSALMGRGGAKTYALGMLGEINKGLHRKYTPTAL